jgi:hypothetical protein
MHRNSGLNELAEIWTRIRVYRVLYMITATEKVQGEKYGVTWGNCFWRLSLTSKSSNSRSRDSRALRPSMPCTTLVRSKQSIQLVRMLPFCCDRTLPSSPLVRKLPCWATVGWIIAHNFSIFLHSAMRCDYSPFALSFRACIPHAFIYLYLHTVDNERRMCIQLSSSKLQLITLLTCSGNGATSEIALE